MADEKDDTDKGGDDKDKALAAATAKQAELLEETKKFRARVRELEAAETERAAKLQEAEDEKARQAKDVEKLETGWKDKLSKAEGEGFLWKSRYEGLVIDGGLEKAFEAVKVNPIMREAVVALVKSKHDVQLDEKGAATIDGKPLADFVSDWAKSDTGKAYVLNGNGGGGAGGSGNGGGGGGGEPNPFKTGNLTQQGFLFKTDRAKHDRLKAEAGIR